MKRILVVISLVLAAFIIVTPEVRALTVTVNTGPYSSGSGGEFNITGDLGNFATFCLETNEYFSPGSSYSVIINYQAVAGGVGGAGPSGGDPISVGTAWLYSQFRAGTLSGYDFSGNPGRVASAGALQNTIWWLEDEIGDPGAGNAFRNAVIAEFGSVAAAKADNAVDGYGVFALNLYDSNGARAQDMLAVPEPVTLLLLGLGLVGVAGFRRRFKI